MFFWFRLNGVSKPIPQELVDFLFQISGGYNTFVLPALADYVLHRNDESNDFKFTYGINSCEYSSDLQCTFIIAGRDGWISLLSYRTTLISCIHLWCFSVHRYYDHRGTRKTNDRTTNHIIDDICRGGRRSHDGKWLQRVELEAKTRFLGWRGTQYHICSVHSSSPRGTGEFIYYNIYLLSYVVFTNEHRHLLKCDSCNVQATHMAR